MFKNFKELPTSKKLVYYLFINCTIIEIFTLVITFINVLQVSDTLTNPDYSPLLALIGAFVTECLSYCIYCLKSGKENTAGGINYLLAEEEQKRQTLEIEKKLRIDDVEDDSANG